jgi:Ca2+-binding RTX toxin-like protein
MAQYQARGAQLGFTATNAGGAQGLARVVGLRDGGFAVTWIAADAERTAFDGDLYAKVFRADLSATTADAIQLITDTGPTNSYPVNHASARLAGGGFAVFSTDNANYSAGLAANNRDVSLRLYDAAGAALGPPTFLGSASVVGVTVTTLVDGRLVAGWTDTQGTVRAQYFSIEGVPAGQSFVVANPANDIAARPDFAALSNGGWVATYVSQTAGTATAVFYDAQGVVAATRAIATNLTNVEGVQTFDLADGRVIFVWAQSGVGGQLQTRAQIYSADGNAFGSELTLSTNSSSVSSVSGLSDGGFVVGLEPAGAGPLEFKVYNSIGQQSGATLNVANGLEPSVAALADGGFVVVWRQSGSNELKAQAFQAVTVGNLVLNGGAGADTLVGQEGADIINGLGGADSLYGSVGSDQLNGGEGADILDGGAGADTLDGGAGADRMDGGEGNDVYFVDNVADTIFERTSGGTDNVLTTVSYRLQAGSHADILSTTNHGGFALINLTGNELANVIIGNNAANVLDGAGGADKLQGLAGDDVYLVDDADQIFEEVGGGYDNVAASTNYALQAGSYVEVLSTTSHSGTAAINLTGNELDNIIIGNAGSNVLTGGAGSDKLQGLGGNDFYLIDAANDLIFEDVGGGFDNALASTSYSLGTGVNVEILSTTSHAGTAAINLTGNELANILIGNSGSNVLDGGQAADTLQGLAGDDYYVVSGAGDLVLEEASGGVDNVLAQATFALNAGAHVEVLSTSDHAGTAQINLTGNELGNVVIGNAGANVLDGGGGSDVLQGLGGADRFIIRQGYASLSVVDFAPGTDKINLVGFSGLDAGPLAPDAFGTGSTATTAAQRVLYDGTNGSLFYDADGNGAQSAVRIASLGTGLAITANDFVIG